MKRLFQSWFFIIFIIFFVLTTALVAFLPTIVSTQWGKKQVTAFINRSIPGQVEIKQLKLSWMGGQLIEGFLLHDPKGNAIVGFERFYTEASLWQLILKSTRLGQTRLEDLNAFIVTDEKGISNLQSALGIDAGSYYPVVPSAAVSLFQVNAHLSLPMPEKPLAIHVKGATKQGELTGSFELDGVLNGLTSRDWDDMARDAERLLSIEGGKEAEIQAKIVNFPVDLLDRLIALKRPELNGICRQILGDKLNLVVNKEPSKEGLAFNITVLAPLMQGDVKGKLSQGYFHLQEPATFHLNLTPQFLNPLAQNRFHLLEETRLKLVFNDLMFSLAFIEGAESTPACDLSLKAQMDLQPVNLDIYPIGETKLLSLQTSIDSPACEKTVAIHIKGQAQQGNQKPFDIQLDSTALKPTSLKGFIEQVKRTQKTSLSLNELPLEIFKPLAGKQWALLKDFIGEKIDLMAHLQAFDNDMVDVSAQLSSPQLNVSQIRFKMSKEIQLLQPFTLEYTIPLAINKLNIFPHLQLAKSASVNATIYHLNLPLADLNKGRVQAQLTFPSLEFVDPISQDQFQLNQLVLKLEGKTLNELTATVTSQFKPIQVTDSYLAFVENPIQLEAFSHLSVSKKGLEKASFNLHLAGNQLIVKGEGYIDASWHLHVNHPLDIRYQLTSSGLNALQFLDSNQLQLVNKPWLNLQVSPFKLALRPFNLSQLVVSGEAKIDQLALKDVNGYTATIEQVKMPWKIDGASNTLFFDLKGNAQTPHHRKPSYLAVRLMIEEWLSEGQINFDHLKVEAISHLSALPISLISSLSSKSDLTPLFGPTIDIELKTLIDRDQDSPGYWDMNIDSAHFHAKARLKFDEAITLYESSTNKAADIRWTLTPEGYEYLKKLTDQGKLSSVLLEPLTVKGVISKLHIPLKQKLLGKGGQIEIELTTNEAKWKDPTDRSIQKMRIDSIFNSQDLLDHLNFATTIYTQDKPTIVFNGVIKDWVDEKGKQQLNQSSVKADLKIQHLPLRFIPSWFFLDSSATHKLQAVIGEDLSGEIHLETERMTGLVSAQFQGNRGHALLDGHLEKGLLTLRRPLEWQVQVTPELSYAFLSQSLPLFSTAFAADQPLKLTIEPNGFVLPLFPFNLKGATIPRGIIQLGQVYFHNEGEFKSMINLLKPLANKQISIWFTPLYFSLEKGQLVANRVDMLVGQEYSLASWGEFDLHSHQLNMVLGLTTYALQYAFDIQGLDPSYILQIPIKGKKGSISVDKKKATGRISSLVAQTKGGAGGKILGTLLDIVSSDQGDPQPPSPTTHPLPWQDKLDAQIASTQKNTENAWEVVEQEEKQTDPKSKKKQERELSLKEIGKEASSILFNSLKK